MPNNETVDIAAFFPFKAKLVEVERKASSMDFAYGRSGARSLLFSKKGWDESYAYRNRGQQTQGKGKFEITCQGQRLQKWLRIQRQK